MSKIASMLTGLLASISAHAQQDSWVMLTGTNRMDGQQSISLVTVSPDKFSRGRRVAELHIRCQMGEADLIVKAHAQIELESNPGDARSMRIKFDDDRAQKERGTESTSGDALFIAFPRIWIKRIAGARVMYVELTTFRSGPSNVKFAVGGLYKHRAEVAKHCGIELPAPVQGIN